MGEHEEMVVGQLVRTSVAGEDRGRIIGRPDAGGRFRGVCAVA